MGYEAAMRVPVLADHVGFRECARLVGDGLTVCGEHGEGDGRSILSLTKLELKRGDTVTVTVKASTRRATARTLARVLNVLRGEEKTEWQQLLPVVIKTPRKR